MYDDGLSRTFSALADPTRRAILARLTSGDASVAELALPFEMSKQAISKHLTVLEQAGLISRGRDAQRRPSFIKLEPLQQIDEWLDEYRRIWERRLTNLERELENHNQGS